MAVTEKQRHDLFTKIEETLGSEHAATMMELLSKQDVEGLRADIEGLRAEVATKDDLHRLRRDFLNWLFAAMGVQTAALGLLVAIAG